MHQTLTRSSALIGRCALVSRPDSTVGGKFTNHSSYLQLLPGYFHRFGGNLCLNWHQLGLCHGFSSFLLCCFHPTSFKTSLHMISDAKNTFSYIIIAFYGSMQTFTPITQRSPFLGLSDNKLTSRSKEYY